MEVGLGKLGLTPGRFWAISPQELRTMAHGRFGKPEKMLSKRWLDKMIEKDEKRDG